jgi:dTDP-4-dehydrorhamnose reductase
MEHNINISDSKQKLSILITGGKGQLGMDCTHVLSPDHAVTSVDVDTIDITDPAQVGAICRKINPAVIINCAAYTQVDQCETETVAARSVNAVGPAHLAACARQYDASLIHISTDYVFDGQKPLPEPYLETDPTTPVSVYGQTKLDGERAVAASGCRCIILRTAWLYGFHGRNFLKTILKKALLAPETALKVVNDQFGSPTWSYRLALQIRRLINSDAGGIYHASAEGYGTWFDLASAFLEKMNVPHRIVPCATADYPTPAARPKNAILENRRLTEEKRNIMTDWRHDLGEFIAIYGDRLLAECQANNKK